MKKILFGVVALFAFALIAPAATGLGLSQTNEPFKVIEVEKTRANVPGFMIYPREYGNNVTLMEYDHDSESSRVRDWDICPSPSQAYVAADWLNVDPQYVRPINEPNAFAIELPEPKWVKLDFGRLQYMENAELVSPDSLVRSYEILVQNATWRCISKHDASVPLDPMTNVKLVDSKSTPSNGSEVTLSIDEVQSWCTSNCEALKLERLVEDNGVANPKGIKLGIMGKECSVFSIPEGISWHDNKGHHQGPEQNVTICTAAFRR